MKKHYSLYFLLLVLSFICKKETLAQTIERLPCVEKKFSIVVHIVKDSLNGLGTLNPASVSQAEAKVQASIDALKAHFAPICISFEICEFRYIDNYYFLQLETVAKFNELLTLYNVERRINLFYTESWGLTGSITNPNTGGISLPGTELKTLLYSMGSYFGLTPTQGDLLELVNGSNSTTAGDVLTDTPADPFLSSDNSPGYIDTVYLLPGDTLFSTQGDTVILNECRYIAMRKDATGEYYRPILGNAMSGYSELCLCNPPNAYTRKQYKKMADTYLSNTEMW